MTWTSDPVPAHPVLGAVAAVIDSMHAVDAVDPSYMRPEDKATALTQALLARDLVEGLLLRLVTAAGEVAEHAGAKDVGAWLTATARVDRGAAARTHRLAHALDDRWHAAAAGVRGGAVTIDQAHVITRCLDDLAAIGGEAGDGTPSVPAVSREVLAMAEERLVALAADHTPAELRRLGEKILSVVAPEVAEETERRQLEAAEAKASAATRLTMRRRGDGSTDLSARIPDALAARLTATLDAFTSPRTATGPSWTPGAGIIDATTGAKLPADRIRGHAFAALLEAIPDDVMPLQGGSTTTVVVTIDLETLLSGLGQGALLDGAPITAEQARRLACNARLVPAVLGKDSEVLDLGRTSRLFSKAQKLKMAMEHPTCRAQGCTVPSGRCEAHHWRRPWAAGGTTDRDDGKLLCPWHHHRAHDTAYLVKHLPNGDVRFSRRQ